MSDVVCHVCMCSHLAISRHICPTVGAYRCTLLSVIGVRSISGATWRGRAVIPLSQEVGPIWEKCRQKQNKNRLTLLKQNTTCPSVSSTSCRICVKVDSNSCPTVCIYMCVCLFSVQSVEVSDIVLFVLLLRSRPWM